MKIFQLTFVLLFTLSFSFSQTDKNVNFNRVNSTIDSTINDEIVLIQEFVVFASIDSVWNAYTTKNGWENWAVSIAEIDFRIGGLIKTNYNPEGTIGDSTTITTHIINYVPRKILTLQAEITSNFPEFMKKEAENFYNVIYFEELDNESVYVRSYGIGYKNTEKYLSLLKYFIPANEMSLMNLIEYLERD
ncbi:MAG: SRPBCC domain-containing protein [Bacteroidota bacterium]